MQALPRQIGPYRVVRRIGQGGMADVFLATAFGASGFEKKVALKVLLPEWQGNAEIERLLIEEALLGALFSHRNLVQVHDLGTAQGSYFLRMDYVDGADLGALLRVQRPPRPVALFIAAEIALALDYLHNLRGDDQKPLGLVHRDISPSNILCSRAGEVKLGDFGIAKATLLAGNTRGGVRKGKYAYMAPEQVDGATLSARTDQFGLGVMLVEMLSGYRPFDGDSPLETMERIRAAAPPPLVELDQPLRELLLRCLTRDPLRRFEDAGPLRAAILGLSEPIAGPEQLAAWVNAALRLRG
ncbi:MAG TPA: serine/threonine-protein kinase [Myxococcales bacterium]|jgi:serine/threonine-protein kinase|nr:serine/threonine-protein kinase [Myxococcales bacterium]